MWQVVEDESSELQKLYNPFGREYQEWHFLIQSKAYAQFSSLRIPSDEELVDMYPVQNSWKEEKERNPDLTFREWDAQQGDTLCLGANERKDLEVKMIFDRITSGNVPTTFLSNLRSQILAKYAEQFFIESHCMQSPTVGHTAGIRYESKDISTVDSVFWYLYQQACAFNGLEGELIMYFVLLSYFIGPSNKTAVQIGTLRGASRVCFRHLRFGVFCSSCGTCVNAVATQDFREESRQRDLDTHMA